MKLYLSLVARMRALIDEGVFKAGGKVFSLRHASQHFNCSISSVLKAYDILEADGIIASHPQSGYYVVHREPNKTSANKKTTSLVAKNLNILDMDPSRLVLTTLKAIRESGTIPLGSPFPDPHLFPLKQIRRYEKALSADDTEWGVLNDLPPGNKNLRQQIARRYQFLGLDISPDDIVITHGATEAISLCLQAVAKAGDTIALESPGYYALANVVERMGMKVAEVRTHPTEGIEIDALLALTQNVSVSAVLLTANFQNPLGGIMPEAKKKMLVDFLAERNIPLIEDDVYQELYFSELAPKPAKAYDKTGLVMHCGSFSKSLAPGYRIGWTVPGQYRADVEKLMFVNSLSIPSAPQIAIAKLMTRDSYQAHLKNLRHTLKSNAVLMRTVIAESFPQGTIQSTPSGGYVIWVQLPEGLDSLALYRQCIDQGISIAPGPIFTRKKSLVNYIRLNYSHQWTPEIEQAVREVGRLAKVMLGGS